jgi:hypothetical protein
MARVPGHHSLNTAAGSARLLYAATSVHTGHHRPEAAASQSKLRHEHVEGREDEIPLSAEEGLCPPASFGDSGERLWRKAVFLDIIFSTTWIIGFINTKSSFIAFCPKYGFKSTRFR